MKKTAEPSEVLELLTDKSVQVQIRKVNPKFNRADLLDEILESWPSGQKGSPGPSTRSSSRPRPAPRTGR